jgi:serine/threonine-protein kinase
MRVSAAGGRPETLTTPDVNAGEIRHILPAILPGARAVLFTALLSSANDNTSSASGIIAVVDTQTGTRTNLIRGGSQAEYVAPGYLVYNTAAGLMAVRFEATRLRVEGDPIRVTESVLTKPSLAAEFSVSRDGTLVYVPGGAIQAIGAAAVAQPARTLMWVDRRGKEEPLETPARPYVYARLSPDGTRVAVDVRDPQADIWIWDIARRTLSRLTDNPALETSPVWTPDGKRVIFGSQREGAATLYWQPSDGAGGAERLTTGSNNQVPTGISADGRRLLFWEATPRTDRDVRVLHLDGDRASETLLGSAFAEGNAVFSPDAHWVAYESNESGSTQVYVRPFPEVGRQRVQISARAAVNRCGRTRDASSSTSTNATS